MVRSVHVAVAACPHTLLCRTGSGAGSWDDLSVLLGGHGIRAADEPLALPELLIPLQLLLLLH